MHDAIRELLRQSASNSISDALNAIFQLAILLEKNTFQDTNSEHYQENLRPELISILLDPDDQREIVKTFAQLIILDQDKRPSLFWALGKAHPVVAVGEVLDLIHDFGEEFDPKACYQAMIALENHLAFGSSDTPDSEVSYQFKKVSPKHFLREMRYSGEMRLIVVAERLIETLRRLDGR
jgi:hypothetical protein